MHSYLIIGNQTRRDKEIQARLLGFHISPFDVITISASETLIGIKDVREFIAKIQLAPSQSPLVAGLIPDASMLSKDAQQALLKTIEEPPSTAIIFLGVAQKNILTATILSRCESVVLTATDEPSRALSISASFIDEILSSSFGQRLSLLSVPCKTKEDSKIFLRDAISILSEKLTAQSSKDTKQIATILTRLIHLYTVNQASMNMQLLIENAFL